MRKILLASVFALAPFSAYADSRAIELMLRANDRVQIALDLDICANDGLTESRFVRSILHPLDHAAYDAVRDALSAEYAAVAEPTDSNLLAIDIAFCEVVADR